MKKAKKYSFIFHIYLKGDFDDEDVLMFNTTYLSQFWVRWCSQKTSGVLLTCASVLVNIVHWSDVSD